MLALTRALLLGSASAEIFLKEDFSGDWESRWVKSNWKEDTAEAGKWEVSAGEFFGDAEISKGLKTSEDAKFYAISTRFDKFSNAEKDLVVQYTVKHEQNIDCGGGYVKIFPSSVDQSTLQGGANEDKYNIMFGPDICGYTKRTHVIFAYKGENKLIKKEPRCESDQMTHLYQLVVKPDQTYKVSIDQQEVQSGSLTDDWDFLPPKKIKDPALSKPSDWVDEAMMDDPEDKKPDGWDDIPKTIVDPDATQPEDWDEEDDGVWEAPTIDNPEYKGEWTVKRISNPEYKGSWVHPEIDNPDWAPDDSIGKYDDFGVLAFEIWQVKSGTIFDSLIVTDSVAEADAFADETWKKTKDAEKKMKEEKDAEKAAKDKEEAATADDESEANDEEVEEEEKESKDEL